jgi:outer membrane immunogenic protein
MKRILFAGAVALIATSPALAADLPAVAPPQAPAVYAPPVAPVYNWGGLYIGINGGYGFGNSDWNATPGFGGGATGTGNFDIDGELAGGTIGANFQSGQIVFGVEADGDWTNITGSSSSGDCTGATCQTSNDWLTTFRGRLGYAFDRVLVYGTGGGAVGDVKSSLSVPGFTGVSSSSTEFGWTAGAGVEVGITENITAKVEYLYMDLSNGTLACPAGTCGAALSIPVQFDASLVRAGLNFKFNPF